LPSTFPPPTTNIDGVISTSPPARKILPTIPLPTLSARMPPALTLFRFVLKSALNILQHLQSILLFHQQPVDRLRLSYSRCRFHRHQYYYYSTLPATLPDHGSGEPPLSQSTGITIPDTACDVVLPAPKLFPAFGVMPPPTVLVSTPSVLTAAALPPASALPLFPYSTYFRPFAAVPPKISQIVMSENSPISNHFCPGYLQS